MLMCVAAELYYSVNIKICNHFIYELDILLRVSGEEEKECC